MSLIHQIVDKVYVINLEKDKERLGTIEKQLRKHQITYERVVGIDGAKLNGVANHQFTPLCNTFCTAGMKGCALSHMSIFQKVLENNYQSVLILEDDVEIADDFDSRLYDAYKSIPGDYDVIYLGCTYNCSNKGKVAKTINWLVGTQPRLHQDQVQATNGSIGTYGYIISRNFVEKVIHKPITNHIDLQISKWLQEIDGKGYSISPDIIWPRETKNGSNLSDSYPRGLNSILNQIKLEEGVPVSWIMGENLFRFGWFNVNPLILLLIFLIFLIPPIWFPVILGWLLLELIISYDTWNTFRYLVLLGIPMIFATWLKSS
jgi:GR25 family glycosyltransferase involved in LPS biosynthesis